MDERLLVRRLSLFGLGTAALLALPTPAHACSPNPRVVEDVRVTDGLDTCLTVESTYDPGDHEAPTLRIENTCDEPVEVRLPDCRPCHEFATEDCFDCNREWVELGGEASSDLVFQLEFPIDDHVGETVESTIDWVRGDASGTLTLEIDMTEQHPDAQADDACPGFCSVCTEGSPTALSALLLLLAGWTRRPRRMRD